MRNRVFVVAAFCALALVATLRAAELAGTWSATFATDVGEQQYTFTFTGSGAQLAGTAKSNLLGETKLTNVKVEGDKVTFEENATFQDMPLRIVYTGTFSGNDELRFSRVIADMFTENFVAKRAK